MKVTATAPAPHELCIRASTPTSRHSRHTSRACSVCRRRKTKCDGVEPACGTCTVQGHECVYSQEPDKRKTRDTHLAIEDLQEKVARLEEKILRQSLKENAWPRLSGALRVKSACREASRADVVEVTCVINRGEIAQMPMPGQRAFLIMESDVTVNTDAQEDELENDTENSPISP